MKLLAKALIIVIVMFVSTGCGKGVYNEESEHLYSTEEFTITEIKLHEYYGEDVDSADGVYFTSYDVKGSLPVIGDMVICTFDEYGDLVRVEKK